MRLSNRSFPYPVVGNRDDVPGASFQAAIEMLTDRESVFLDIAIQNSSNTLNELIRTRAAIYVVHVECSNTLFRRAYEFSDCAYRVQIPIDRLNDAVEVNVFARALNDVTNYRVDSSHADYGDEVFSVNSGEILALGEGQLFYVEAPFDALSPISSIMQIRESTLDGDLPITVIYEEQKIQVILSKKDFADYKLLKNQEPVAVGLTTVIVLPVLMEAIRTLQQNEYGDEIRWVRALRKKLEEMGNKETEDPLELAQRILELPIRRTFSAMRMIAEGSS